KPAAKKDVVIHAVIFTMKEGTPEKMVDDVIRDCHGMLAKIKSVRSLKAGKPTKERAEKITQTGYHVGMIILVDDMEGLKAYLEDPIHVEFVKKYGKHFDIEKLKVYDFTSSSEK
ncbi:MAG: Dabb family protein, partial [Gemmataceae bacterium]